MPGRLARRYDGPVLQLGSIGAVAAGSLQLNGTWTAVAVNDGFFNDKPSVTTSGSSTTTTTQQYNFAAGSYAAPIAQPKLYDTAAAGSGASAVWTFTGLIPGQSYQINTFNQSQGGLATFTATDPSGALLTVGVVNQNSYTIGNFLNKGTVSEVVTVKTVNGTITNTNTYNYSDVYQPYYAENEVGVFTATGSTMVLTLTGNAATPLVADTALLIPLGSNTGPQNNFHVAPGSKAIDAGDPTSTWLAEPSFNGGRVNQGYDGNTPQAQVTPGTQSVQVLSPPGLSKYQIGEQVPINFQTDGLTAQQPILLLHAGGSSVATGLTGNWSADAYRTTGQTINNTVSAALIGTIANVPTALFSSAAGLANYPAAGQALDFQLPVPNGTYAMTLYFADPAANAAGQRVFNIIANGQTLQANYDIYAAAKAQYAGDGSHAVALTLNVTVTGGQGLKLDLTYVSGFGGPLVNGIALQQTNPGGTAAPTATVQVSSDNGTTWSTIASSVPVNSYGQGQYVWTVNQTSNGNTALVRVISNTVTGTSQPFLLANGGNNYYVNDGSKAGDQYTTQVGNDANSGKSPDQPLASLAALLRAYPIGPGANIYVDAGTYNLISNVNLPAADSGTATQPVVITGPTDGAPAILNRGNTAAGTDVFDLLGISNITIQNLTIEGAYDGIDLLNASSGVVLLNDVISNNLNIGVFATAYANVSNVLIKNSTISNNGSLVYGYGIYIGYNNSNFLFQNDNVWGTAGTGIYTQGLNQTIQGGAYHDNRGVGIYAYNAALVQGVAAYGNFNGDGIYDSGGTVTASTAFGNSAYGIEATVATNNLVYDQFNTSDAGIGVGSNDTATGNTVYGSVYGIFVNGGAVADNNVLYDNSASGIYYGLSAPAELAGNTIYGNGYGITGGEYYTTPLVSIDGNLIYNNVTAGIYLVGGANQHIINNTIDQPTGTAIAIIANPANNYSAMPVGTVIENNILAVAVRPRPGNPSRRRDRFHQQLQLLRHHRHRNDRHMGGRRLHQPPAWYYATGLDQSSKDRRSAVRQRDQSRLYQAAGQPDRGDRRIRHRLRHHRHLDPVHRPGRRRRRRGRVHRAAERRRNQRHRHLDRHRPDRRHGLPGRRQLAVQLHHRHRQLHRARRQRPGADGHPDQPVQQRLHRHHRRRRRLHPARTDHRHHRQHHHHAYRPELRRRQREHGDRRRGAGAGRRRQHRRQQQLPFATNILRHRRRRPRLGVHPGARPQRRPDQPGLRRQHATGPGQPGRTDVADHQPGTVLQARGRRAGADHHHQQQPRRIAAAGPDQRRGRGRRLRHPGQLAGERLSGHRRHLHQHRRDNRPAPACPPPCSPPAPAPAARAPAPP